MRKVLVLGSNSFSGSDFIDLLLETKRFEVLGVSRSLEKSALFLPYKKRNSDYFTFKQVDLNRDLALLKGIIEDFQPDYIVNFAAQSEVAPSWNNPDHWFQTNVVALTKLIDYLKELSSLKKYVHISSPEVYGTCRGMITEDAPLSPSTPYAASKAAADLSLSTYYKNFNFPLVTVRSTNVYGPHQQLFKIIPRSLIFIKQGKKIPLHGGGNAVKSYIHIRDISRGELAIMEDGVVGEIYHLSPRQGVSVKEIVTRIARIMGKEFDDVVEIVSERLGQDLAYTIDSSKARRELGWNDEISLDKGLKETAAWIGNNFSMVASEPLSYIHKE